MADTYFKPDIVSFPDTFDDMELTWLKGTAREEGTNQVLAHVEIHLTDKEVEKLDKLVQRIYRRVWSEA